MPASLPEEEGSKTKCLREKSSTLGRRACVGESHPLSPRRLRGSGGEATPNGIARSANAPQPLRCKLHHTHDHHTPLDLASPPPHRPTACFLPFAQTPQSPKMYPLSSRTAPPTSMSLPTGPSTPRSSSSSSSFVTILLLLAATVLLSVLRAEHFLVTLLPRPPPPSPPSAAAPQLFFATTTTTTTLPPPALRHRHHRHRRLPPPKGWFHACHPTETTVWEDWRACVETHLPKTKAFKDVLGTARARRLWSSQRSNATAVLLEFRAWAAELRFSVNNALVNLPVHWRVQVVGGPAVCALASHLYPTEIHAGKVVLTDLGFDDMAQTRVSAVLTNLSLYERLLGDQWLFFQYDSAICRPQRHLLPTFLAKPYGWWGAPWVHWRRLPKMCGNGGFSLRTRKFVTTILTQFPWVNQRVSNNEDWFICNKAADLYHDAASADEHPPWLVPAPQEEAMQFSVESVFYPTPFGVHQFWRDMRAPNATALTSFFQACPEALGVLPADVLTRRPEWREVVCAETGKVAGPGEGKPTGRFEYGHHCVVSSSKEEKG